jgi:hypothetical protein
MSGGTLSIDCCATFNGVINGSVGSLYLRCNAFPSGYLSGFSGTVAQNI